MEREELKIKEREVKCWKLHVLWSIMEEIPSGPEVAKGSGTASILSLEDDIEQYFTVNYL